ncbi:RimK family alpha-L-glutamate ligase [Mycoplasmoides alvi]|uniref:RimK family alpha-L-glutamate ligase n=1 Tax=Mycoplasmoides alvi TaxID=78580 RepID=UPI000696589E|nr:RimK family alpha-L-glutamate ligase [Mycoplasmoides alvi]
MNKKLTIVYNPYVNKLKNNEQFILINKAAKLLNIKLFNIPSNNIFSLISSKNIKLPTKKILFLDKNIALAKLLENYGYLLYNNSDAINVCDNKALTHVHLMNEGIAQPKTLIGPLTFNLNTSKQNYLSFLKIIKKSFKFPLIVKEVYGSFGKQVYLINNIEEFDTKFNKLMNKQIIIQEFINYNPGTSIRVLIINKKIVGILKQTNTLDFRSNLSQNATGTIITNISNDHKKMLNLIINKLNLFYAGIDFLYDKNKNWIFCEANTNAQLSNISKIYNINFGKTLLNEIINDKKYGM